MLFHDKNIRNQLRQISFKTDLTTNEQSMRLAGEREKSRELDTKQMNEWMAAGKTKKEKKDSVSRDETPIVSKEALVLIKLVPVFSTAI